MGSCMRRSHIMYHNEWCGRLALSMGVHTVLDFPIDYDIGYLACVRSAGHFFSFAPSPFTSRSSLSGISRHSEHFVLLKWQQQQQPVEGDSGMRNSLWREQQQQLQERLVDVN